MFHFPSCSKQGCCDLGAACFEVVQVIEVPGLGARWYISPGHAGFNSVANNRAGYASKAAAVAASARYEAKGRLARAGAR